MPQTDQNKTIYFKKLCDGTYDGMRILSHLKIHINQTFTFSGYNGVGVRDESHIRRKCCHQIDPLTRMAGLPGQL